MSAGGERASTATPGAGVLFDATGTLIEPTASVGEVYHRVARDHGVDLPAWRLDDAFRRILRHAPPRGVEGDTPDERRAGEVAWWFERIRQTFQATDSTARFADFDAFAGALFDVYRGEAAWRVRPGLRDLLADLAERGLPLAVVSNFDHRLPKILESLGIRHFFESIHLPSDIGAAKPERALFAAAATALQRSLDALVYVGDDAPERLSAIATLGLRVVDVSTFSDGEALAAGLPRAVEAALEGVPADPGSGDDA